jgi:hypothetical protein
LKRLEKKQFEKRAKRQIGEFSSFQPFGTQQSLKRLGKKQFEKRAK